MSGKNALEQARLLDQFYTDRAVARSCVAFAEAHLPAALLDRGPTWLEPSAGDGAFLDALAGPTLAIDIAPARADIHAADFLAWAPGAAARPLIAVGNPPFGKNSALAVRFFNHAARFCAAVCFVVPRTFEKASVQNRLDPRFHLTAQMPIGPDAFRYAGRPCTVPAAFQVWLVQDEPRPRRSDPTTHPDFRFTGRDGADLAVQRVGANAGRVRLDASACAPSSHYFLTCTAPRALVARRLGGVDWAPIKHRTAGNPSIAKGELVAAYAAAAAEVAA